MASALYHVASHIESVHKPAASSREVECESIFQAQLTQHDRCCGGVDVVGSGGSNDNCVDAVGVNARLLHQKFGGLTGQIRSTEPFFREDAALLDTSTRSNPFVVGIDNARQFLVVKDIVGHVTGDA